MCIVDWPLHFHPVEISLVYQVPNPTLKNPVDQDQPGSRATVQAMDETTPDLAAMTLKQTTQRPVTM
jgi:hypothetical protein